MCLNLIREHSVPKEFAPKKKKNYEFFCFLVKRSKEILIPEGHDHSITEIMVNYVPCVDGDLLGFYSLNKTGEGFIVNLNPSSLKLYQGCCNGVE